MAEGVQNVYDADQVAAAITPPRFRHGGREYVGVFPSAQQWIAIVLRHGALLAGAVGAEVWQLHLREFFDLVFPPASPPTSPRWRHAIARWFPLPAAPPSVAEIVLSLTYRRQLEAYNLFLGTLASELWWAGVRTPEPGPASETRETTTTEPTHSRADASPVRTG